MAVNSTSNGTRRAVKVSLDKLLRVRSALAREVSEQLSHGEPQAMKLVDDLLAIEERILYTDPVLYARRQGSWARAEATQLHVPGSGGAGCSRCTATGLRAAGVDE